MIFSRYGSLNTRASQRMRLRLHSMKPLSKQNEKAQDSRIGPSLFSLLLQSQSASDQKRDIT